MQVYEHIRYVLPAVVDEGIPSILTTGSLLLCPT